MPPLAPPLLLHGVGEDPAHGLQQQLRGHLGQPVQQHLQLLPVLHKHGLVLALTHRHNVSRRPPTSPSTRLGGILTSFSKLYSSSYVSFFMTASMIACGEEEALVNSLL